MPLITHKKLTGIDVHAMHSFTFSNESERENAVVSADDLYKVAIQINDNSLWLLIAVIPTTWKKI